MGNVMPGAWAAANQFEPGRRKIFIAFAEILHLGDVDMIGVHQGCIEFAVNTHFHRITVFDQFGNDCFFTENRFGKIFQIRFRFGQPFTVFRIIARKKSFHVAMIFGESRPGIPGGILGITAFFPAVKSQDLICLQSTFIQTDIVDEHI